jgi:heme/copper-type cytochrome/quinol oxidase subunit 2
MAHMTLRLLALILAIVLAAPAAVLLLRGVRDAREGDESAGRRRLEALWAVVPAALLVALIALSAAA